MQRDELSMNLPVQTILVPQGAEYRAVCGGLRGIQNPPVVLPIQIGPVATRQHLKALLENGTISKGSAVLIMGLCGSLTPRYSIADVVLIQECFKGSTISDSAISSSAPDAPGSLFYDRSLTERLQKKLGDRAELVKAITSDRMIWSAAEKRSLAQYADVVDMEGYAALEVFKQAGVAASMLRVVSDDSQHDLPDLGLAISPEGALLPGRMIIRMLRQPIGAARLIRGSLRSLKTLQETTSLLFNP